MERPDEAIKSSRYVAFNCQGCFIHRCYEVHNWLKYLEDEMKTYITEVGMVLGAIGAGCLAVGELVASVTWTAIGTFCTVVGGAFIVGRVSKKLKG